MFQDVNVAKSAPFALLTEYQKSLYPPKVFKIAPISANYAKFAHFVNIFYLSFRSLTIDREPRKIGANQQDSAQFTHLLRELHEFHTFRSKLIHI